MQNAKFKMQTKTASLISGAAAAVLFVCTAFLGAQAPPPQAPAAPAQPAAQGAAAGRGRGLPGTESGWATFQGTCFACHTTRSLGKGPTANEIRQMTPERIYAGLTRPSHTTEAETGVQALSDIQRRRVAEFMSGRPMGSIGAGEAKAMPNQCATNPTMTDPTRSAGWNGWGNDLANTRFQPAAAARLTAADVP
jgi:mono/diheme cytochrome c family protein